MAHESGQQVAKRLLEALDTNDELDCEDAEAQIPALVDAELSGEDVDNDPAYAALLRHLDRCEKCMELYVKLAEEMEALTGAVEIPPQVSLTPPSFFLPARQSDSVILRVLRGLTRRFELTLTPPQIAPALPTLSSGQRVELFSDRLPEVPGEPLAVVTLHVAEESADLLVALRETGPPKHWQVQLTIGDVTHSQATDERGIARFSGLPRKDLQQLTLLWSELPAES